jgi:hypothetical protein
MLYGLEDFDEETSNMIFKASEGVVRIETFVDEIKVLLK